MLVPTVTRVVIVLPEAGLCLMSSTDSSAIGSSLRNCSERGDVAFTEGVVVVAERLLLLCNGRSEEDLCALGKPPGILRRRDGRDLPGVSDFRGGLLL